MSTLIRSFVFINFVADFVNPDDPDDTSFDPHPTRYPMVELEYPNHDASERFYSIFSPNGFILIMPCCRFILLTPKDKDHYNPILDLEKTLYTIVECQHIVL